MSLVLKIYSLKEWKQIETLTNKMKKNPNNDHINKQSKH